MRQFQAVYIIWLRDLKRHFRDRARIVGFLKEMLVAPVPSWSIALGKVVSGATIASFQGGLMLLAPIVGIHLSVGMLLMVIPTMFLVSFSMTGLGILVATRLKSMQGFQVVMNFVMMPMFFLSGAMFQLQNAPPVDGYAVEGRSAYLRRRRDPVNHGE